MQVGEPKDPIESEKEQKECDTAKRRENFNLLEFACVMKSVEKKCEQIKKLHNPEIVDVTVTSRLNKRTLDVGISGKRMNKFPRIQTSTPVDNSSRREPRTLSPDLISPDQTATQQIPAPFVLEGSENEPSDEPTPPAGSPTGASLELDCTRISPSLRIETSNDRDIGANALMDAASRAGILFQVVRDTTLTIMKDMPHFL